MANGAWSSPLFWGGAYLFGVCMTLLVWGIPRLKATVLAMPRWVPKLVVVFWVVPALAMPLVPQPRLDWPVFVGWAVGGPLVLAFVVIGNLARREIGRVPALRPKSDLITSGIYGAIRHPLYLGNILFAVGWALCFRAMHGLLFAALVAVCYLVLIALEERGLERDYGDEYREYGRQVRWRILPGLF